MHKTLPIITTATRSKNNPGDTFIGTGLQWLVEQATGPDTPWYIVSKFTQQAFVAELPEMVRAGVAIYAGTPQYNRFSDWKFWYDDELWRKHINKHRIPVAVFAGGAGHSKPDITPERFAKEASRDRLTRKLLRARQKHALCFTVRDLHSHALLDRLEIDNELLPCSATFAGRYYRVEADPVSRRVAVVTAKPTFVEGVAPQVVIDRFLGIMATLQEAGYSPVLVCHNVKGYQAYRDLLGQDELFYTNDYHALLKFYGTCEGIVSARLHATLPAYGIGGVERLVNISIDVRGNAVDPLGIPNVPFARATPETVLTMLQNNRVDNEHRRRQLDVAAAKYAEVADTALRNAGWLRAEY